MLALGILSAKVRPCFVRMHTFLIRKLDYVVSLKDVDFLDTIDSVDLHALEAVLQLRVTSGNGLVRDLFIAKKQLEPRIDMCKRFTVA